MDRESRALVMCAVWDTASERADWRTDGSSTAEPLWSVRHTSPL
jgi:hypothetical protein